MEAKKVASELIDAMDTKTDKMSVEETREVLTELISLCELRIMSIDDGEVD